MKKIIFSALVITLCLLLKSCNSVEPPTGLTINLTLEDVSCTEAWITISSNLRLPATIVLTQNNQTTKTINLTRPDSLLYIDSLLPNSSYSFQATNDAYRVTSNQLQLTTLDTTNHNITWQVFTFGEHSHSRLNDIAIVGNEIWAVGEIYLNDSLGQPDPNPYGLIHWNGYEWKVKRITAQNPSGGYSYIIPTGILVLSPTEIWLVRGGVYLFNGDSITQAYWLVNYSGYNGGIFNNGESASKLWGISSEGLYTVGLKGALAHFDGTSWGRIESGTEVDLFDIWGSEEGTIWTCGYSDDYSTSALLRYSGEQWETVYEGNSANQSNGFYIGPISGVWVANDFRIYMMNWSGIYIQKNNNEFFLEKEIADFSDVGFGVDGTDDNNIFACGEGFVGHWNGVSYTEYPELYRDFRTFYSVSAEGNTVCAVGTDYNGFNYSQAVIALGKIN